MFQPQHLTPPPLVSTQECSSPAEIAPLEGLTAGGGDVWGALVAGVGVTTGAGLAVDEQAAATNTATMIGVPSRKCDKRISCPFGRCTSRDVRPLRLAAV
jgi:hypothetical protein